LPSKAWKEGVKEGVKEGIKEGVKGRFLKLNLILNLKSLSLFFLNDRKVTKEVFLKGEDFA
jgi:hypothetical protein